MKNKKFHYSTKKYSSSVIRKQEIGEKTYLGPYINFVKKYVKPGAEILDIGCGAGLSSDMLSKHYKVTGIDLSKPLINYAHKNFTHIKFQVGDARKTSFKDNTFDAVMACAFLEHVEEVDDVLNEMIRITKKNGKIIIVSPNWFSPLRPIKAFFNPKAYMVMGKNRIEIIGSFFRNIYYTFQKPINAKYVFRKPDLENKELVGNDIDMVYVVNQYDLNFFFEKHNCKVLKINADTFRFSSIPMIATWIGLVAQKK